MYARQHLRPLHIYSVLLHCSDSRHFVVQYRCAWAKICVNNFLIDKLSMGLLQCFSSDGKAQALDQVQVRVTGDMEDQK